MPSGGQLAVTPGSGMAVNVAPGYCVVPSLTGSTSGGYLFGLLAATALTVVGSRPDQPAGRRWCAPTSPTPATRRTSSQIEVLTGTPTSGATLSNLAGAPSAPTNSVVLAYVLVPAGATSILPGNIDLPVPWTVAQGGVLPIDSADAIPSGGYPGLLVYDTRRAVSATCLRGRSSSRKLLPFAPQSASKTSNTTINQTSQVTLCSVTITTDGVTDIEVTYKWPGLNNPTNSNSQFIAQLYIDSTQVDATYEGMDSGVSNTDKGGCVVYRTSAALGTTPSAGTHTIAFKASNTSGGGSQIQVVGAAASPVTLYVKPVCA